MDPITVGSVFSGVGGFDLGLERVGMQIKWQIEIDDYATKILEKHWLNVRRYKDVKEVEGSKLEKVELMCGGFSCQSVSIAGKRKGKKDERWLWPEFYRLICDVQPEWVIVENVPGLLSIDDGRLFLGILRDFSTAGYNGEWNIVSATSVGAIHCRERIFIIAHSNKFRQSWSRLLWGGAKWTEEMGTERKIETPNIESIRCIEGQQDKSLSEGERGLGFTRQTSLTDNGSPRIQRNSNEKIQGFEGLSWCKDIRRVEDLFNRSDIPEPLIRRNIHGIPHRMDRIRCLGNAILPQVAEFVGRTIISAINGES